MLERRCRDCKQIKTRAAFDDDSHRQDGVAVYCKDCLADRAELYTGEKVCSTCHESKPRVQYNRMITRKDGLDPRCKPCAQAAKRASLERRPLSPEKRRLYQARYKAKHPDRQREVQQRRVLRKYGLTLEQYEAILAGQNGRCAICHKVSDRLVIDHCHRTGEVRGILCGTCNVGVGMFDDSAEHLQAAIKYLAENAVKSGVQQ